MGLATLQKLVYVGIVQGCLDLALSIDLAGLCDLDLSVAIVIDRAYLLRSAFAIRIGGPLALSTLTFPASVSNADYTVRFSRGSLFSRSRGNINYSNRALHTLSIRG